MRLLAAHTVIKVNWRSCQRLCSFCLIETISYLLISTEGIRERWFHFLVNIYHLMNQAHMQTHPSREGLLMSPKRRGRGEEINKKTTDHRWINSISKGRQQQKMGEGKEEERDIFSHIFNAAYFIVLIPSRFQMLKLSLCGAVGQSVIEKFEGVFLAETVTRPVGTAVVFLLSFLCFLIASTTRMRPKSVSSDITGDASRLFPNPPSRPDAVAHVEDPRDLSGELRPPWIRPVLSSLDLRWCDSFQRKPRRLFTWSGPHRPVLTPHL